MKKHEEINKIKENLEQELRQKESLVENLLKNELVIVRFFKFSF